MKFAVLLKSSLFLNNFYCLFLFINKTLRLNNLKTRTVMNMKISVFVICVKAIIYLLLYIMHECTFNTENKKMKSWTDPAPSVFWVTPKKEKKNIDPTSKKCQLFIMKSRTVIMKISTKMALHIFHLRHDFSLKLKNSLSTL